MKRYLKGTLLLPLLLQASITSATTHEQNSITLKEVQDKKTANLHPNENLGALSISDTNNSLSTVKYSQTVKVVDNQKFLGLLSDNLFTEFKTSYFPKFVAYDFNKLEKENNSQIKFEKQILNFSHNAIGSNFLNYLVFAFLVFAIFEQCFIAYSKDHSFLTRKKNSFCSSLAMLFIKIEQFKKNEQKLASDNYLFRDVLSSRYHKNTLSVQHS